MSIPQSSGRVGLTDSVIFRSVQGVHSVAFDASDLYVFKGQGSQAAGSDALFKRYPGAQSVKKGRSKLSCFNPIKTKTTTLEIWTNSISLKNKLEYH